MMKNIYLLLAAVLVIVGMLGFVMPSPVLGMFEVNTLHNIVHLTTGAITLVATMRGLGVMRALGRIFGIGYLALAIVGFVHADLFGLMHVNLADNLLHSALAALFVYVGFLGPPW